MPTAPEQPHNPLHGITLEQMLQALVNHYGWRTLGSRIRIKCFNDNPTIKSSLTFLRKTPWARQKVEELYVSMVQFQARAAKRQLEPIPETTSRIENGS
jgi:uncharacterized protein (DUF2132 family)